MGRVSWPWSYGSWIYNYLCNRCLLPLMFWVQILIRVRCTTLCDKVCQWLAAGWWFSPGTPVSSTNKTDCHNIAEILLKVALNTIKQTNNLLLIQAHVCQSCFYLIICAHDICHMSASLYDDVSLTIMTYPHLDIFSWFFMFYFFFLFLLFLLLLFHILCRTLFLHNLWYNIYLMLPCKINWYCLPILKTAIFYTENCSVRALLSCMSLMVCSHVMCCLTHKIRHENK